MLICKCFRGPGIVTLLAVILAVVPAWPAGTQGVGNTRPGTLFDSLARVMPETFGAEASAASPNNLLMRDRLLPALCVAAHENHDTSEPLRRLDLCFPQFLEARHDEYLLGPSILLAPAPTGATRAAWIPPGDWINLWDGKIISGPGMLTNQAPPDKILIWIKSGTVLPLTPQMDDPGRKPWDPVLIDVYPKISATNTATLYENDPAASSSLSEESRTTSLSCSADDTSKVVHLQIDAAIGDLAGAVTNRIWKIRIHPPASWPNDFGPTEFKVNGQTMSGDDLSSQKLSRSPRAMPFGDKAGAPDGNVYELSLPAAPVTQSKTIDITFAEWE